MCTCLVCSWLKADPKKIVFIFAHFHLDILKEVCIPSLNLVLLSRDLTMIKIYTPNPPVGVDLEGRTIQVGIVITAGRPRVSAHGHAARAARQARSAGP